MDDLRDFAANQPGRPFLNAIPICKLEDWNDTDTASISFNNCTNFAFNRNTRDILQPGNLGPADKSFSQADLNGRFGRFVRKTTQGSIHDGLIPLGTDLRQARLYSAAPVALFFQEGEKKSGHDYHWIALRRDFYTCCDHPDSLFWGHKVGYDNAEDCEPYDGNIFEASSDAGYNYFSGYYAVPASLTK